MTYEVSDTDVEAELSYAFLHAVAAQAKATCTVSNRLSDNRGIDAQLTCWGLNGGGKTEVDLKVQLKATVALPTDLGSHFSYSIKKVQQYNDLRASAYAIPRILVVLFLPKDISSWMHVSHDALALRRSAYWVSLVGAPATSSSSVTVYLPKANLLTPESLRALFEDLSVGQIPQYQPPGVQE